MIRIRIVSISVAMYCSRLHTTANENLLVLLT